MNSFTSEEAEKLVTKGQGGHGIHGPGAWMSRAANRNREGRSSGAPRQRAIAALQKHLERHPRDKQSEAHLTSLMSA